MDDGSLKITPARDARRQAILQIARDVFVEEGFAAASMSTIAARLGGSKGTLYNYFRSKEELFSAVIREECERKQELFFEGFSPDHPDLPTVLREVGLRYATHILDERTLIFSRIVIAESTRFPELGRALYESGPLRGRERIAVFIAHAMERGELRRADPHRMADQYCDLCLASQYRKRLMNAAPPPSPAEIAADVEAAVQVILTAYAADGASGPWLANPS